MNKSFLAIGIVFASLTGCSTTQQVPRHLPSLKQGQTSAKISATPAQSPAEPTPAGERINWSDIETITNGTRAAWKIAISHDEQGNLSSQAWKEARQKDELEAMQQLQDLAKRFPDSSSISLMMGQVKEHHGQKKQAIAYYEESVGKNTRNPIYWIKLAEARRKSDDLAEAIKVYRRLVNDYPAFSSAKIGLARCLKQQDPRSVEARQLVSAVLAANPYDFEGLSLQKEFKSSK